MDVDAAPSRAISASDGREPGGAAVLQRLDEPALDELERDLDQLLARERVADLDGGTLVRVVLAELLAREHRGAADPVAAGRRAVEDERRCRRPRACARVTRSAGSSPTHIALTRQLPRVGLVEDRLAADRRARRRELP